MYEWFSMRKTEADGQASQWLSEEVFSSACAALPLVSIDLIITRPGDHPPLHRLGRQASVVVGVVKTAQHQHIDADVAHLCLRRVDREGADHSTAWVGQRNQLLPCHLGRSHDIVVEQGVDPAGQDDLSLNLGK